MFDPMIHRGDVDRLRLSPYRARRMKTNRSAIVLAAGKGAPLAEVYDGVTFQDLVDRSRKQPALDFAI